MSNKRTPWIVWGIVISILLYIATGVIGLALDTNKPNPLLHSVFRVLRCPAIYFPGWESWDSRTATMSFRTWGWYSNLGDVFNALFWGFGIGSLFCFVSGFKNNDAV